MIKINLELKIFYLFPSKDDEIKEEDFCDVVVPYQMLLNDLTDSDSLQLKKRKIIDDENRKKIKQDSINDADNQEIQDDTIEETNSDEEIDAKNINSYSQEVLCKDNLESEEVIKYGSLFIKNL